MALASWTWTPGGGIAGLGLVPGLVVVPHADPPSWASAIERFRSWLPAGLGLLGVMERTAVISVAESPAPELVGLAASADWRSSARARPAGWWPARILHPRSSWQPAAAFDCPAPEAATPGAATTFRPSPRPDPRFRHLTIRLVFGGDRAAPDALDSNLSVRHSCQRPETVLDTAYHDPESYQAEIERRAIAQLVGGPQYEARSAGP